MKKYTFDIYYSLTERVEIDVEDWMNEAHARNLAYEEASERDHSKAEDIHLDGCSVVDIEYNNTEDYEQIQ